MRIVDEWNHSDIKVTAFHMNGKYSLKFERHLLEQWYKFRDGQIESLGQLKSLLSDEFYQKIVQNFSEMDNNRIELFKKIEDSYDFDTII